MGSYLEDVQLMPQDILKVSAKPCVRAFNNRKLTIDYMARRGFSSAERTRLLS